MRCLGSAQHTHNPPDEPRTRRMWRNKKEKKEKENRKKKSLKTKQTFLNTKIEVRGLSPEKYKEIIVRLSFYSSPLLLRKQELRAHGQTTNTFQYHSCCFSGNAKDLLIQHIEGAFNRWRYKYQKNKLAAALFQIFKHFIPRQSRHFFFLNVHGGHDSFMQTITYALSW